jgi:hypothetical protein
MLNTGLDYPGGEKKKYWREGGREREREREREHEFISTYRIIVGSML